MDHPLMYGELAPWFHLLTAPAEYADEAATIEAAIDEYARRPVHTMLELGSGGGNNASHLKKRFAMTLVDISPNMLATSRKINPECEHLEGDMRTVRLQKRFDAVLIHDAISYILTEDDLLSSMRTAFEHLQPGGAAVFVPDYVAENYEPRTESGGHDGEDGRSMRYLEWTMPLQGSVYRAAFVYLLRELDGALRIEHEQHTASAFPRQTWMHLLTQAGFEPHVRPETHWANPAADRDVFVGVRRPD